MSWQASHMFYKFVLIFHVCFTQHNIEEILLNAFHSSPILRVTASSLLLHHSYYLLDNNNYSPSLTHLNNHLKHSYIPHFHHSYKPYFQNFHSSYKKLFTLAHLAGAHFLHVLHLTQFTLALFPHTLKFSINKTFPQFIIELTNYKVLFSYFLE